MSQEIEWTGTDDWEVVQVESVAGQATAMSLCKSCNHVFLGEVDHPCEKNQIDAFTRRRALAKEFREQYDAAHKICPQCGGKPYPANYMGSNIIVVTDRGVNPDYRDNSEYLCKCGWGGVMHDMVPNPIVDFSDPTLVIYGKRNG